MTTNHACLASSGMYQLFYTHTHTYMSQGGVLPLLLFTPRMFISLLDNSFISKLSYTIDLLHFWNLLLQHVKVCQCAYAHVGMYIYYLCTSYIASNMSCVSHVSPPLDSFNKAIPLDVVACNFVTHTTLICPHHENRMLSYFYFGKNKNKNWTKCWHTLSCVR